MKDGNVRRLAWIDLKLAKQGTQAQAGTFVPDTDTDGPVLVMDGKRDHGLVEPGVGHSRHRKQQLAGQKGRRFFHLLQDARPAPAAQVL